MSRRPPMTQGRSPDRGSARANPGANIQPGHVRAFQMVTSPHYDDKITLWSCSINGEPGVAIVLVDEELEPGKVAVLPLFVAVTSGMKLEFEGGSGEDGGEGDGAPKRPDCTGIARQFAINAATLVAGGGE